MTFFISDYISGGEVKLLDLVKAIVAGAICITAIIKGGIVAIIIIAFTWLMVAAIKEA